MDFNDCNRSDCPFRYVSFDEYNGRCFKCGKNDRLKRNNYCLFIILWTIIGLILLTNEPESEPEFEPETEIAPISITS